MKYRTHVVLDALTSTECREADGRLVDYAEPHTSEDGVDCRCTFTPVNCEESPHGNHCAHEIGESYTQGDVEADHFMVKCCFCNAQTTVSWRQMTSPKPGHGVHVVDVWRKETWPEGWKEG